MIRLSFPWKLLNCTRPGKCVSSLCVLRVDVRWTTPVSSSHGLVPPIFMDCTVSIPPQPGLCQNSLVSPVISTRDRLLLLTTQSSRKILEILSCTEKASISGWDQQKHRQANIRLSCSVGPCGSPACKKGLYHMGCRKGWQLA